MYNAGPIVTSPAAEEKLRRLFGLGTVLSFHDETKVLSFHDETKVETKTVWAAAGTPDTCFRNSLQDLKKITSAVVADVAAA